MYMYCCAKCRSFRVYEDENGNHTCPSCGDLLTFLDVTKEKWEGLSRDEKRNVVQSAIAKKKSKEIRLVSSIKLGKRTYTVNKVDERAFFGMNKLKKVILPKTITSIGKEAFGSCPNLKTLVVKNKTLKKKLKKSKKYIKKIMFEGDKII